MERLLQIAFCFFIASALYLDAGALDHLKQIDGIPDNLSKMGCIERIYLINLDKRPEKLASTLNQLAPYGIIPFRISAVNGWDLSLEDLNDIGVIFTRKMKGGFWGTRYPVDENFMPHHEKIQTVGANYFCHCMSRGAIGCFLSHLSCITHAYNSGLQNCWILEDDIEVLKDPRQLSDLIKKLSAKVGKNNWDILYTDQDTKNQNGIYVPCSSFAKRPDFDPRNDPTLKTIVSKEFRRVGARYGTYSMIVSRSGMKKILNFVKAHQIFLPIDMELGFPDGIKLFTVREDIVSTFIRAASDNGAPNFLLNN